MPYGDHSLNVSSSRTQEGYYSGRIAREKLRGSLTTDHKLAKEANRSPNPPRTPPEKSLVVRGYGDRLQCDLGGPLYLAVALYGFCLPSMATNG